MIMFEGHDPYLVALSVAVAILGGYTGFGLAARIRVTPEGHHRVLLAGAAAFLAIGIWTMHFIGMLAAPLPPDTSYLILPTIVSFLICVLVVGVSLFFVSTGEPTLGRLASSAVLMGVGSVHHDGRVLTAIEGLNMAGLQTITLAAEEGLALLNGTQVSTALAAAGLFEAEDVFLAGLVAGAMTTDACLGSDVPFDPRIHAVRGQPGQIDAARTLKDLMADSPLRASHMDCGRVQDPYSLRCQPQVMGACLDTLRHAAAVIGREANAVSDNPLVFADTGEVISGGNFHAEPIAIAADTMAIAVAEIGALSERRTALLMDAKMSSLPAFLVPEPGLNSGFMIAQVTAAALASENKAMAFPGSVDSLPTSANQEDHVSMATYAARRVGDMADNTAGIVAIELLAAAQGIDLRKPVTTSPKLSAALQALRAKVAFWDQDREMAPDIEAAKALIATPLFRELVPLRVTG